MDCSACRSADIIFVTIFGCSADHHCGHTAPFPWPNSRWVPCFTRGTTPLGVIEAAIRITQHGFRAGMKIKATAHGAVPSAHDGVGVGDGATRHGYVDPAGGSCDQAFRFPLYQCWSSRWLSIMWVSALLASGQHESGTAPEGRPTVRMLRFHSRRRQLARTA